MADVELKRFISIFQQVKESKEEYTDSGEFTDEFYGVVEILKSERFKNWMAITDQNYSTNCVDAHRELVEALEELEKEIETADK